MEHIMVIIWAVMIQWQTYFILLYNKYRDLNANNPMPGDIISTGTPPGVGMGMKPPRYLKNGDIVELGIEGLGTQKQHFEADI